jgi:predicted membrane protein
MKKKVVLGIIIMFVGVFLLFHNMGYFPWSIYHIIISWQALLIGIGFVLLFDEKPGNKSGGIILTAIGTLFLLPRIFDISISGFFIPMIVIAIGILFVIKATTKKRINTNFSRGHVSFESKHGGLDSEANPNHDGVISREYVFTGSKEQWTDRQVKYIEINSVFSNVELDCTQLELSSDVERVQVKITSVFGGIVLYVPGHWNIIVQKTSIFGSFIDNRPRHVIQSANGKQVYFEAEAIFGSGEIRCYE